MFIKTILLLVLCFIENNKSLVTLNDYNYRETDINLPECGLNRVARRITISYNQKCFLNRYPNKTLLSFDSMKLLKESPISRAIYGSNAYLGEAPWTVFIERRRLKFYQWGCTGSLITFEWVLTAAHCHDNSTWGYINVIAGNNKRESGEVRKANLAKWIRHPAFVNPAEEFPGVDPELLPVLRDYHDIALIKLSSKFTRHLKDGNIYRINTICLPGAFDKNYVKENATFYGFGIINSEYDTPTNLQKGVVILNPSEECAHSKYICANQSGNDARPCPGDSGGPLVQYIEKNRAVQYGVHRGSVEEANSTERCTGKSTMAVWVPVPNFIDWILDTIAMN